MFDKLIESEPQGAEFHGRKPYFMVSSLVMGILFITAVVFSIYAADISLGTDSFQLMTMTAPVPETTAQPEVEEPRQQQTAANQQSALPTRKLNMSRTDEPTIVPTTTSAVANNELSRPFGDFKVSKVDSGPGPYSGPARSTGDEGGPSVASLTPSRPAETAVAEVAPPPVRKAEAKPVTSLGVINGRAKNLPVPKYPSTAVALNLQGKVDVQVLIDEDGNVISANAVSGHPILRAPAVQAARGAKFSTTYLSKVPVKVSGVIVYNFKR